MSLQSEPVFINQKVDPRERFRSGDGFGQHYDVSRAELEFLVEQLVAHNRWQGKRVELNAMTSRQFVDWLEAKLKALGVKKVVPDTTTLRAAWSRAKRIARANQALHEVLAEPMNGKAPKICNTWSERY